MGASSFITPLGLQLLESREKELNEQFLKDQEELGELIRADPGDGPHDGMYIQANMKVGMLEKQLQEVRQTIKTAQVAKKPTQNVTIDFGHIVKVILEYSDGEKEELNVVVLGAAETTIIKSVIPDDMQAVSAQSALGNAIMGHQVGSSFSYGSGAQIVKGKVLRIDIWKAAFIE